MSTLTIRIPMVTVSTTNVREHWAKRARRAKEQRGMAFMWTKCLDRLTFPLTITITRISPRKLDDDNLRSALKSVRDGLADRLGIDDRNECVTWAYGQQKGDTGEQSVLIEATEKAA